MISIDSKINDITEKYYDLVYKLAYAKTRNRFDAEDVLQEVFLRYIRKQPQFENNDHEKAWFLRVTINCSINLFVSSSKNKTTPLDIVNFGLNDEEKVLDEFLAQLPSKYLTVIHLFYYEDLKIVEIAKLLSMKESTVKMQLTRARRLLKTYMEVDKENV
ncbi:MAG: RNA polymerase sigma factor [Clostridium sp.]|nr:RNA polymerase sigma factor [Clostridium sp.]